jgi:hypothetical protein
VRFFIYVAALLLLSPSFLIAQTTWYVPDDFPTIDEATFDAAVVDGDTIIVRPGTYVENVYFYGKAVTLTSEMGPEVTVIDGNKTGSAVTCFHGEGHDTILDGFTITNGVGSPFPHQGLVGGGMYNYYNCNPTVTNCIFLLNTASYGAGMYNIDSSPKVIDCAFIDNTAWICGGMYNVGASSTVINCVFIGNTGTNTIGGMGIHVESSATVTGCTFIGNSSGREGGGISITVHHAVATISNCLFIGNSAEDYGGGIVNQGFLVPNQQIITHCTFYNNTAGVSGGGLYESGPTDSILANSILWDNAPDQIDSDGSDLVVNYSCIEGGWPGTGNIQSDPLFVNPSANDLHLTYLSPCKESGHNAGAIPLEDFEGDPRIAYGTVDMGADEFYTHLYYTGDATPNGDIELKFTDIPGTAPVGFWVGSVILQTPLPTPYGDWWNLWWLDFSFPTAGPIVLAPIPSNGVRFFRVLCLQYPLIRIPSTSRG